MTDKMTTSAPVSTYRPLWAAWEAYRMASQTWKDLFQYAPLAIGHSWKDLSPGEKKIVVDAFSTALSALIASAPPAVEWRPAEEAPPEAGWIVVRSSTYYRWLPYKPDGQRQMGRKGRWQMMTSEYGGWTNATLPEGAEWKPTNPETE